MRNLVIKQIHNESLKTLSPSLEDINNKILLTSIDESSNTIILFTSDLKIYLIEYSFLSPSILKYEIELDSALCDYSDLMLSLMDQLEKKNNPFLYIFYKVEIETIILVLKSGEIFNIPTNDQKSKLVQNLCDKNINNEIIAFEISPNQEYIIAVLSNFKIIALSYDSLNKINGCDLDDGDLSDISKDNNICKKAFISFKSSGDLFGISYTINNGVKCMVRDSQLKLIKGPGRADDNIVFSVAEKPLKKLEPILSFMPSGSLIAFFDKENKKIIFSEKNCLCHGEFNIVLDNKIKNISQMKIIKWSLDKPMLLLVFEAELKDKEEKNEYIQIYFRSNYEWTLKYEIIKKNDKKILYSIFSDFTRDQIILIYDDKTIEFINFELEYTSSLHDGNNFNSNYGEICTIFNNNKIRYSPIGIVNIPPPMALVNLDNNKGNKFLWYNNYFFTFSNSSDNNNYIIQVFETQCRTMKFLYDLNIINNNDDKNNFDLNFIKKIIFVPLFTQNSGVFILNEINQNDLSNEYLIFISFDNIVYDINNNGNITSFNNKNCIHYKKVKLSNYNSGIIFTSVKFNNSYEKEYFDEKKILSHIPSLVEQSLNDINKNKKSKNEKENDLLSAALAKNKNKNDKKNINININLEKELSGLSGNSFGKNSLGQNSFEMNENENEEDYKIYFYFTGYNTISKEQTFHKLWYNIKSQNISDLNSYGNDDNNLSNIVHDPKKNGRIIQIYSSLSYKNVEIIIYLTHNNYLYENGILLATEINSFIIFKHFLLFTQLSSSPYSTLHLVDLNEEKTIENFKKLASGKNANLLYKQNLSYKDFYMRTLERGSTIVTGSGIKIILQLPRGNLETIMPRLIVLDEIKKNILNKKYQDAFLLCRKNKINLNLIYDIDPKLFMDNLSLFIQEVKKEDYLNLFLNALIDDYCEEFKILFNYKKNLNSTGGDNKNKINNDTKTNKICLAIRKLLLSGKFNENYNYISTVLITYIKQNPPMYLDALKLVQKLKIEKNHEKADSALEFLCWIVKADTLFDFALITYDFELVIMVAKHTQKDPKEYLKYLHELEEIKKRDPIKMKYKINMDQKNYLGALKELSKGGDKYFDDALNLIKKHNLYDEALSLYNSPLYELFYAKIYENKGDYLSNLPNNDKNKDNNLAAMCYFRSRNYLKAFKLFCSLGKVIEAMNLLNEIDINELNKDLYTILIELLDVIKENFAKNELEKFYLYLVNNKIWAKLSTPNEFSEIVNKLIELMIDNKLYNLAYFSTINIMRLVKDDAKLSDLLSGLIKLLNDNLSLQYELNYNLLKKNLLFFKEKYNRLLIVQEIKKEHPEVYELDINKDEEIDNVSDSGSVMSGSSKKSGKSSSSKMSKSKKTKKKNMKRNVKEGSPMEEEFIIENLKDLKISDQFIKDMNELCDVLMMTKMNNKSEELRNILNEYINEVNCKVKKLFLYKQIQYVNDHPEICELFPNFDLNSILFSDNEKEGNIINIKKEQKK